MCYKRLVLRIWSKTLQFKKVGENFSNINKVEVNKNKHDLPSYCKFCLISINKILFYGLLLFIFWITYIAYGGTKIFYVLTASKGLNPALHMSFLVYSVGATPYWGKGLLGEEKKKMLLWPNYSALLWVMPLTLSLQHFILFLCRKAQGLFSGHFLWIAIATKVFVIELIFFFFFFFFPVWIFA